ncbi:hypothetical protein ACH4RA_13860 [Streptomyces smyrnaeus]|uniref:hypothetical protein n=1 Tax=Streptomyces TaxID=1883 RepID=UPI001B36DF82|nr:hypothetical protein [Streptomyces sp. B15]MBQ1119398.1 hypothetical protein [Streptomyces sp. B15]
MALIALAADKGAPGVTTAAVALSAVWPRRALLAEMDTAGGDLVYRSPAANGRPLDPNTGLLSLAATARRGLAAEQLWDHSQRLSGGLEVLVGLGNAEQSAGLAGQWDTLGRAFATLADSPHPQLAADVIADCGRIGPETASVALFPHAALVLLVARDEPEQIARVRDRALALTARLHGAGRGMAPLAQPMLGVLLVCQAQGAAKVAGQVNDMLVASRAGAQIVGVLAHDPMGAEQLAGRRRGRVERSLLVRSVRKIATDIHQQYGAAWAPTAPPQQQPPAAGVGQGRMGTQGPAPAPVAGQPAGPAEPLPSAPTPPPPTERPGQPGHPGQPGQPGWPGQPGQPGSVPDRTPPPGQGPSYGGPEYGAPGRQAAAPPQAARPQPVPAPSESARGGPVQSEPPQGGSARGLKGFRGRRRPTAPQPAPAPAPTPPVPLPGSGERTRDEGAAS